MLLQLQRSVNLARYVRGCAAGMHRILWVSLSAALISARLSGPAGAAYSEDEFIAIEEMIEAGNWVNLRRYLTENPGILIGDDPFTLELLKFLNNTESLYTALIFEPSLFPDLSKAPRDDETAALPTPAPSPARAQPLRAGTESQIY